jgi:hypothetical protein
MSQMVGTAGRHLQPDPALPTRQTESTGKLSGHHGIVKGVVLLYVTASVPSNIPAPTTTWPRPNRSSGRRRLVTLAGGVLLLLAGWALPAAGQQPGVPWITLLPPTARSAGLAGASTALVGDAGTVFVNAAGVAIVRRAALEGMVGRIPDPAAPTSLAGTVRVGQFHVAAGYQHLSLAEGSPQVENTLLVGSVVYRFGLFAFSGAAKRVTVRDSSAVTSSATTGDISVIIAVFDIAALSFSVQNIGQPELAPGMVLPAITRLGSSLNLVDPQGTFRLLGTLEVVWTDGFGTRTIIGGEAGLVFNKIGVEARLGYGSQGPLEGQSNWSLGGTLVLGPVDVDYAFQEESVFGSRAHRLGIRLTL